MRKFYGPKLEEGRIRDGEYGSGPGNPCGAFRITGPRGGGPRGGWLVIIADNGRGLIMPGWEHVSVSLKNRTPNWQEMCFVKDLFWLPEECVVQYHPPRTIYVNCHPNCLHLWRPLQEQMPMPPAILVGPPC
jgi:hypothetical protein